MQALVLHGKETVRVEEIPSPVLEAGQVRVGIRAALTCGTDLKVFRRGYHAKMIVPPAVFGHELAGVILETAAGVEGWRTGDRVVVANSAPCGQCEWCAREQENLCEHLLFLNGAYAEEIAVPARIVQRNLIRLKPETPFADAALTEPLACVVQGIQDTGLRADERVLVIGPGPIGLMFVALARHLGCEVAVVGRGEKRLAAAQRLGAAHVLDLGRGEDIAGAFKASGLRPFDVVFEAVGKPQTWEAAVGLVRKGGRVNFFGGCPAGTTITLDTTLLHYSGLTLCASFHHTPRSIRQALGYIESGVIRARDFVDGACTLTELPELFRSMAAGNRAVKTLVTVSG